jgi:hypothetical protein
MKYGQYTITTNKIQKYLNCIFTARDRKLLVIIPRMECTKVDEEKLRKDYQKKEEIREKVNQQLSFSA